MNVYIVTTVAEAVANPAAVVWMRGPDWNDFTKIEANFDSFVDRDIIFTSAWQHGIMTARGMGRKNSMVLGEAVDPVPFTRKPTGVMNVVVRGDQGERLFAHVAVGLLLRHGVPVHLTLLGESPSSEIAEDEWVTAVDDTEEEFTRALAECHVFLCVPSNKSQPVDAMRAVTAGCHVVAPRMAGFPEHLCEFGAFYHPVSELAPAAAMIADRIVAINDFMKRCDQELVYGQLKHACEDYAIANSEASIDIQLHEIRVMLKAIKELNG